MRLASLLSAARRCLRRLTIVPAHLVTLAPPQHVVFGQVISNKSLVRRIEALETESDKPVEDVKVADCGELSEEAWQAISSAEAGKAGNDRYEDWCVRRRRCPAL